MKKIIIILGFLFLITGCSNINNSNMDDLIKEIKTSKLNLSNQTRSGYRYYLPTTLGFKKITDFNENLSDGKYNYYLYVDLVSYYNEVKFNYQINSSSYLSKIIENDKLNGYLEINVKNNKYLIEIMDNYAKIEVIVDKEDINKAVANSMILLSTIKYNKNIIRNMLEENNTKTGEETLNIFKTSGKESNYLEYLQEYGNYESNQDDKIPDYDLIK